MDYYQFFYDVNKRRILKAFGHKNPFTTMTEASGAGTIAGAKMEADFYGVVTFEVELKELLECPTATSSSSRTGSSSSLRPLRSAPLPQSMTSSRTTLRTMDH
jgi:hypothetical protein